MVLARLSKMALDLILVSAAVLALVLAMPMSFWNGIDPAIASLASLGIATMAVGFVASRSIRREGKAASLRLQELDESDNQGLQAVSTTPSFVTVIDRSGGEPRLMSLPISPTPHGSPSPLRQRQVKPLLIDR